MDNRNVETLILDKDLDEKYQNEKNKINNYVLTTINMSGFPSGSAVKNLPVMQEPQETGV